MTLCEQKENLINKKITIQLKKDLMKIIMLGMKK